MRWFNSLILYLYEKQSSKVQKLIIKRTQENVKKIELINGEVNSLIGFGKQKIDNKVDSYQNYQYIIELVKFFWRFDTLMIICYIIIALAIYPDGIMDLVILYQCIIFALIYLLYITKCILKFRNYHIIEEQINKQPFYILENFINNKDSLASDISDDLNGFFYPQKKINREKIKIGDIVILQKGYESPADILVLDSCQSQVYIDETEFGISIPKVILPCQSTFVQPKSDTKGQLIEFKLTLNGLIQYTYEKGKKRSLTGFVKLKNDPKIFKFSTENIIFSGERILHTDWILGIVLVSGNNCLRIFKSPKIKRKKTFLIIGMLILAFIISLLTNLIYQNNYAKNLCFYSMLIPLFSIFYKEFVQIYNYLNQPSIQTQIQPQNQILQEQIKGKSLTQDDKHIWIEFNKVKSMTELQAQNKLTKSKDLKNNVVMLKQTNLWKCSKIDLICIEMTSQYFLKSNKIKSIYVDDKQYILCYKTLQQIMNNNIAQIGDNYYKTLLDTGRDHEILDEDKKDYSELINLQSPHSQDQQPIYGGSTNLMFSVSKRNLEGSQQKKLKNSLGKTISFKTKIVTGAQDASINQLQKLQLGEQQFITALFDDLDNQYHERIVAMLLLCEIENKYNESKNTIETYSKNLDDYTIIDFCNRIEYKLKCNIESDKLIFDSNYRIQMKIIEIQGKLKQYKILSQNKQTKNRKGVYSILIKDPEEFNEDEGALVYIKMDTQQFFENTSMNINILETNSTLYYMLKQGERPVIYFKKQLKKKVAQEFLKNKMNIVNSFESDEDKLEQLYLQLEAQSDLLMILGHHQKPNPITFNSLDAFSLANFNTWFISADDYFSVLRFLFNAKFVENENDLSIFNQNDQRALKFSIQSACSALIQQQKLLETQELDKKFIVLSCEALLKIIKDDYMLNHFALIVGFSKGMILCESQEISKVKLQKIASKLSLKICYIGSCSNNQRVYNYSDISFHLNQQYLTRSQPNYLINSLRSAEQILILKCINSSLLAQSILHFWLYEMVLFVFVNLINYVHFGQQSSNLLLLLSQVLTITTQIIAHRKRFQTKELYIKGLIKQRCLIKPLFNKDILIKIFIQGIIDAIISSIPFLCTKYLYGDSNYLPISSFAFIFTLDFIIRIQLFFQLQENQQQQLLGFIVLSLIIVGIIAFVTVPQYEEFQVTYDDMFYSPGYIIRSLILIYIFSYVIKFVITCILQLYNFVEFQNSIITNEDDCKYIEQQKKFKSSKQLLQHSINQRTKFIKQILSNNNQMDDSIYKALNNSINIDEQVELRKYLIFSKSETEIKYLRSHNQTSILYIFFDIAIFINLLIQIKNIENNIALYIIWGVQLFFTITIQVLQFLEVINNIFIYPLECIAILSRFTFQFITIYLLSQDFIINQTLFSTIFLLIMLSYSIQMTHRYIITIGMMTIISIAESLRFVEDDLQYIPQKKALYIIAVFIVFFVALIANYISCYVNEYLRRQNFALQEKLEKEQKKLNDALGILMPRFIKERMARGYIQIQEDQGPVSVMFCDICDFDDLIETEQSKIIGLIDLIYRTFDTICNQCNVQKIETIGHIYVCASGLKDYDIVERTHKNSTQKLVECAQMMMEATNNLKYQDKQINIRIGINYGNVMAGVIGQHKPQFSLIGDTVNTTSRVCTLAEPGKITLTESAYVRVRQLNYQFTEKEINNRNIFVLYELILHKKNAAFNKQADKFPVIKLVNSIQVKKQEMPEKQQSNDSLANAVNPLGFQFELTRKQSMSKRKQSIYQLPMDQFGKTIQDVISGQKILQEVSIRRQTLHRKTRVTRFKEINPKLMSQPEKQVSMQQQLIQPQQQKEQQQVIDQLDNILGNFRVADSQKNIEENIPKSPQTSRAKSQRSLNPNAHLFDSTIQQEEKIEIPKLQCLIGNQEKIETDIMQELIRVKCDFGQSQNQRIYFRQFTFKEMIKIYNIKLFKDMIYYAMLEFIFVLIFQLPILFAMVDNQTYLSVNLTLEGMLAACFIMGLIVVPFCLKDVYQNIFQICMIFSYFINQVFIILIIIINNPLERSYISLTLGFTISLGYYLRALPLFTSKQRKILILLFYIYVIVQLSITNEWNEIIIFLIPIEILLFGQRKQNEDLLSQNYNVHDQYINQQLQQTRIISNLLPPHILPFYFKDDDPIPDMFINATILYADIAGFTKYATSVDAQQVLQMLTSLFNKFDVACTENSVYKLYSIGDSYVVLGVLDAQNGIREEEAYNIINLAFQMLEIVKGLKKNIQYPDINLRIGVHTGNIIAGIVGTDIVRYDIYGSDVAIAKKMEQYSQIGKIMVSEDTKRFLEDTYMGEFAFTLGNEVQNRNRLIQGYFIDRVQLEE